MSTQYATEPNPTASATLNTTTPLTCKNFLQHCKDGYYTGTIFHRVAPGFVIQGGDPTGTGAGGTSIYEYPEFEYDPEARDPNERVVLRNEFHSRLRFNRRGLVGMAKSEDGTYGSQFFITLDNTEREMNGQCTMFGRLEGDSIFTVLKIAEAERVEDTEKPVYPVKVTSCEVGELGPLADKLKDRKTVSTTSGGDKPAAKKKKKNPKAGKALLSFGGDEGEEEMPMRPAKPKFNTKLVADVPGAAPEAQSTSKPQPSEAKQQRKRPHSPSPTRSRSTERKPRPKTPEPQTQLPIQDPESPERSPTPKKESKLSRTNAEIASLKASMRRNVDVGPAVTGRKKTALESMIPETAIRGRRRPPPNSSNGAASSTGPRNAAENEALRLFNAFKAKLEGTESRPSAQTSHTEARTDEGTKGKEQNGDEDDEEAQLCDLHFIANCQSCQSWDNENAEDGDGDNADEEEGWMSHQLQFGKDMLGKDLNWKKNNRDDVDSLMVIDPREKEKDLAGPSGGRKRGLQRDRERERKQERSGDLEWRR
ncbi:uncharacterized protein N7483_006157 [Penicillium malachiteum]|uniref:uncharacterized protein n=1 Tax=Penicillium malachiteum TaxID=1324776 RepID=UPI002547B688|nr:uncharacterized protein N7483_006157 [Penicillium malachiteum]KAJ5731649.1 hypothetical protein N7483_006157 [Penicillium malachiteum]